MGSLKSRVYLDAIYIKTSWIQVSVIFPPARPPASTPSMPCATFSGKIFSLNLVMSIPG